MSTKVELMACAGKKQCAEIVFASCSPAQCSLTLFFLCTNSHRSLIYIWFIGDIYGTKY